MTIFRQCYNVLNNNTGLPLFWFNFLELLFSSVCYLHLTDDPILNYAILGIADIYWRKGSLSCYYKEV